MAEQQRCSFCGTMAENVVEGPSGSYICWRCLQAGKDVLAHMNKSYQCSFCLETVPGNSVVQGEGEVYICSACVESGVKLLSR